MFQMLLLIIYLAFISLGLPDSLLGSAWPSMYQDFSVPVSSSGIVFMIISLGTIISSGQRSDDGGGPVRLFHQPFFPGPVPVGDSLWAWSRERGCFPE